MQNAENRNTFADQPPPVVWPCSKDATGTCPSQNDYCTPWSSAPYWKTTFELEASDYRRPKVYRLCGLLRCKVKDQDSWRATICGPQSRRSDWRPGRSTTEQKVSKRVKISLYASTVGLKRFLGCSFQCSDFTLP